jgi:putative nucleotidyltransferase with HDIG domain
MTRAQALALLQEYTTSESLRKHALAVEAAMRHYAAFLGQDAEKWGIVGLIHDFDYERWPQPPDHTRQGALILRAQGVDEEMVGAVLSHATWNWTEYPLDSPLRKTLFAVDELCGFITAVAYVRPERLAGMTPASVRKKMKQKAFAAAVSRQDIEKGAELMGCPLDDHVARVIAAMQAVSKDLGLGPPG